jgi:intracellular sulfur oxidation DsrE/DsrF family protein
VRAVTGYALAVIGLAATIAIPLNCLAADDPFALTQPTVVQIQQRKDIRVAYDIKDDVWSAGIGEALYYARGLLESYKSMDVAPKQLHVSLVLHSAAAYWLLKESAYQQDRNDPFTFNPNTKVVQELLDHGVSVEICYSTMKANGWTADDIVPGVTIVHDAYTRLIDLQRRGYAYIRF